MNGFYEFHFYLFSLLAIASALLFVTRKNPVPAALWLVNVMFALAGLYVMLDAPFVGVIQVLVYAGAIMVVFVFVVMLLNLGRSGISDMRSLGSRLGAGAVGGRGGVGGNSTATGTGSNATGGNGGTGGSPGGIGGTGGTATASSGTATQGAVGTNG